jgi:hypothetical protein
MAMINQEEFLEMRRIWWIRRAACVTLMGSLLLSGAVAGAQDVGEGSWLKLFDGETTFGWLTVGEAKWTAADGMLQCEDGAGGLLATTSQFTDFELVIRLRVVGEGDSAVLFRSPLEGHPSENGAGSVSIPAGDKDGPWHEVIVIAKGDSVSATLDGAAVEGVSASNKSGHIGVAFHKYHSIRRPATVEVAEARLRPLNLRSIFNGQDLTGWSILPDHASEFKVVEGALNITNGNGQIETEELFKNFLFQLDIISNGEHLNSGVFFRGPKGIFWKGYESQVRNQWMREDRTKPVDFGTGGIYGVQEARTVNATDGEWFSKTIIANGNHFAVWINGLLISDMVDMRPVSPESDGKNGYVPVAGTIHLQGHDPTTDLSFKNMNIQVYPE